MKLIGFLLLVFAGAACATTYTPRYYFNEMLVHNLAGDTIQDVSLQVTDSPKSVTCAEVKKSAICDKRFGKRRYPQQGLELSWTHPDGSRKSETVNPHVPAYFTNAASLRIVLEIREDGSVKSYYEQDEPGRDGIYIGGLLNM